jgi:hypothetical protein
MILRDNAGRRKYQQQNREEAVAEKLLVLHNGVLTFVGC